MLLSLIYVTSLCHINIIQLRDDRTFILKLNRNINHESGPQLP